MIQAVGRVMRKAPGKEYGYVILPIAIPFGADPELSLNDNERYRVIWQVLQALRAHDERFDTTINSIEYNTSDPSSILVDFINFAPARSQREDHFQGSSGEHSDTWEGWSNNGGSHTKRVGAANGGNNSSDAYQSGNTPFHTPHGLHGVQEKIMFAPVEWKDAVYSKIVKKVGNRLYWDDWSKDIGDIATRYTELIGRLLEDPDNQDVFAAFVSSLQQIINPLIDGAQAVEMLAQHIITKPLFDAMFDDQEFTAQNPVSRAMQAVLDKIADNAMFIKEREPLEEFYQTMVARIRSIDNIVGKQQIMVTLYDKFFSKAFPKMSDRLGIVFTPVAVVDYILHSANDALKEHFGKTLGEPGVQLIEPFLGTGTFISRLLSSGIITPEQLEHKYKHEIFGNEIVLLSYYIASINIEAVYRQVRKEQGFPDEYVEFEGISLTDTFHLAENDDVVPGAGFDFTENIARLQRQRESNIQVIVMNPPYSAGQSSANDNNQNLKYPRLDAQIARSYARLSTATLKNKIYDSYFRALRWASDRIKEEGIIAFVSNSSFLDGTTADGVRLSLQREFSEIYIYNLKGNQRTQGERSRREGGKIFGSGSRTGTAITVLVKKPGYQGEATIRYAEMDDYLARQEKLDLLVEQHSISGTNFRALSPNEQGDWLAQRDEFFGTFQAIGDKKTKGKPHTPAIFQQFSGGLVTSRDSWCYNFSSEEIAANMRRMIDNYNAQLDAETQNYDPTLISWSSGLESYFKRGLHLEHKASAIRSSLYRPFCVQNVYFDQRLNERTGQLPQLFPTPGHPNLAFGSVGLGSLKNFSVLMTDILPDFEMVSKAQWCSLYTWVKLSDKEAAPSLFDVFDTPDSLAVDNLILDFSRPIGDQIPRWMGGYERRDNITDATLAAYRQHYRDEPHPEGEHLTKEDIFFYVYALLHHPDYRERYETNLKKELPRIPLVPGFWEYVTIGRELADLHVNYERIEPYPLSYSWAEDTPEDIWERYRIEKLSWAKKGDPTRLIYNQHLTIGDIPVQINDYQIGGRSPIEWVIDRYRVTIDKKSRIGNDPNAYLRELNNPCYVADLIGSLVTVTMRTLTLTRSLPEFIIDIEKTADE